MDNSTEDIIFRDSKAPIQQLHLAGWNKKSSSNNPKDC